MILETIKESNIDSHDIQDSIHPVHLVYPCEFSFHLTGNRLASVHSASSVVTNTYSYTNGNKLTTWTGGSYQYNAAGCITNITHGSDSLALTWNSQYQLTTVSTNGTVAETYTYDPYGRRVKMVSGGVTNYLVYDGTHVMAEVNASGALQKSYMWGAGQQILAWTDYTGGSTNAYYPLTDFMGTIHAVVDNSGSIVESYRFDAWGRVLGVYNSNGAPLSESAIGNHYLFHGKWFSWKTGLYFNQARWYDPVTGRFILKDPSGIVGGLNQYEFCFNNPVNYIDENGENAIAAADYWAGGAGAGYNQGGFGGWWKIQTGNTMGMFINIWHAQEMEKHAGLAGEYWDECKVTSAKHIAAVGGYSVLDYVQFTGLQKLGGLTGEGRQGTRIFQLRNKATGRPVFRLDKGPVPGKVGPRIHYHRLPDISLHHPYQGGI